jgi:hypothetical protein
MQKFSPCTDFFEKLYHIWGFKYVSFLLVLLDLVWLVESAAEQHSLPTIEIPKDPFS